MKRLGTRGLGFLLTVCLLLPAVTLPARADVSVTASAAIVMDYDTGEVLYGKDIDTMRVPASMTKIMTAYIIYEEMAAGNLTKDTLVPVSSTAASMSRDGVNYPASVPLTAGASHTVDTFLKLILIPSASASCYAMAEYISGSEAAFVARMNETAARLGMEANYQNSHGAKPHYQTARSVATLIREFIGTYPDVLNYTSLRSFSFNGNTITNTNLLLGSYSYPGADGFKTGTIAESGYCLSATAVRGGRRVITVVMNSSSNPNRYLDSQKLLDYGFQEIARRDAVRDTMTIHYAGGPEEVRLNSDFTVSFVLSGPRPSGYPIPGGAWWVDGEEVERLGAFTPYDGQRLSYTHCITDSGRQSVTIELTLELPGGVVKLDGRTLGVSDREPALFRDIDGHWAEAQIVSVVEMEIYNGVSALYFEPDGTMTRAMFVTALGRLADRLGIDTANGGETPFLDAEPGQWYSDCLAWAWEQALIQGVGDNRFGLEDAVTRQEAATLLCRFMDRYAILLPGEGEAAFPDRGDIADWALEAVEEAARIGLIQGYPDGRFAPGDNSTRAEVAVVLIRFADALAAWAETAAPEGGDDAPLGTESVEASPLYA